MSGDLGRHYVARINWISVHVPETGIVINDDITKLRRIDLFHIHGWRSRNIRALWHGLLSGTVPEPVVVTRAEKNAVLPRPEQAASLKWNGSALLVVSW